MIPPLTITDYLWSKQVDYYITVSFPGRKGGGEGKADALWMHYEKKMEEVDKNLVRDPNVTGSIST